MFRFKIKKVKAKKKYSEPDVKEILKNVELKSDFLKKLYKEKNHGDKVR